MENIEKLQPRAFTRFCMRIGAVPSSYLASLSYEEQLLWFYNFLNQKIKRNLFFFFSMIVQFISSYYNYWIRSLPVESLFCHAAASCTFSPAKYVI